MRKELLVALLAASFIFAGALSASAGSITWTIVQTAAMAGKSPGLDMRLGTSDDGSSLCNYSNATACVTSGSPTSGSYSFAYLDFQIPASCALASDPHKAGDPCTQNSDCGSPVGVCVPCGDASYTFFARNPENTSRGAGTYTVEACEGSFEYTAVSIGSSEATFGSGGGCLTLVAGTDTTSGCGVGDVSSLYTMDLWVRNPLNMAACGFKAGVLPGLSLAGRVYDASAAAGTAICQYTTGEIDAILAAAGGTGYVSILCGTGTLPSGIEAACLSNSPWNSKIIAKTTSVAACDDECASGCMAGTAEGVE
jgi:hypothetical protein